MRKGSATVEPPREPIKTRNKSANQERRNSVSEITDYFSSKMAGGGKTTNPKKNKDKDKEKESNNPPQISTNESTAIESENWADQVSHEENNTSRGDKHAEQNADSSHTSVKDKKAISTSSKETQTTEDVILKELSAIKEKLNALDTDVNDPKNGINAVLAKNSLRTDNLYTDIHGAVDGIKVRLSNMEIKTNENLRKIEIIESKCATVSALLENNKRLAHELQIMQGLVQKISQQSTANSHQVMDLTKRGMEQNLLIQGIDDDIEVSDPKRETPMFAPKERCKYSVLKFFKEQMKLDLSVEDIWKAHRTGARKPDKVRPMVVKLSYSAKDLVMEKISELKGKKNAKTQQTFFISEQIPEGITETRKQVSKRLDQLKEQNEKKPKEERSKIQVINNTILIDDELDKLEVQTPAPEDLFVDSNQQKEINSLQEKMIETEPIVVKNSEFTALALKVHSIKQIKQAYIGIYQRYPASDHIMLAYALKEKGQLKHGGCDDREYGASARMKRLIFESKTRNTAVFILRRYGGVHLGFERFKTIETLTRNAIEMLQKEYP